MGGCLGSTGNANPISQGRAIRCAWGKFCRGYRIESREGELTADFTGIDDYEVPGHRIPTETALATAFQQHEIKLSLDEFLEQTRDQEIIYLITKDLLRDYFPRKSGAPAFGHFHAVKAIVGDWYENRVRVIGKDACYKKLLYYGDRDGGRSRMEAACQHAELRYLTNSTLTNSSLRERFKVSDRYRAQISRIISEAVSKGRLRIVDTETWPVKTLRPGWMLS